jgi:hypothetical protein
MKFSVRHHAPAAFAVLSPFLFGAALPSARAEAILQCFNLSHNEIAGRIPEIAEAGYSALWVPPPTKASGGMSVGYDLVDPFDIGSTPQSGQYPTRYGTKADLLNLIDVAHRFGMRVYFDNVMNHRAYSVPGYNENTPVDIYPGMVAEDFHLRKTSDGYYRMWEDIDWNNATEWDVMYRPLSGLIDIAHENLWSDGWGPCNGNFGTSMRDWQLKPCIVRHAYRPEDTWKLFDRIPYPGRPNEFYTPGGDALRETDDGKQLNLYVGFGNSRADAAISAFLEKHPDQEGWFRTNDALHGVSMTLVSNYPNFYKEKVDDYLSRAVRWLIDTTHVDGLRLDAVKHVPYDFFGSTGDDKNRSTYGYLGQAQWQFNMTRGYSDWEDQRNSVFNIDDPRDDLMAFGEHLGYPPDTGPYIDAGMRLVDNDLRNRLNDAFPNNLLWGLQHPNSAGFGSDHGVMHAQSHDNDEVYRKPLHHAYYFMRRGLGLVYSDGNNRAPMLTDSGGAFPRWACTDYLGQWGESQIPTLLSVHENFAMYDDRGIDMDFQPGNFMAWERGGTFPWNRLLVMFNSDWAAHQTVWTAGSFPAAAGSTDGGDAYLYNYASTYPRYMAHRKGVDGWPEAPYAWASQLAGGEIEIPPDSYALWGYKNPDPSEYWAAAVSNANYAAGCTNTSRSGLSEVITVYDDGKPAPTCGVVRKDGVDGDPGFNPNGVEDDDPTDYAYTMAIPVVKGNDTAFGIHLDGEAEHVMVRLDGGMDLNGKTHAGGDPRDNPPALSHDEYLGFESADDFFVQRIWAEVFAAVETRYSDNGCVLKSGDATTYEVAIGGATNVWTNSYGIAFDTTWKNPSFLYHDPRGTGTYRDENGASTSSRAASAKPAKKAAPAVDVPAAVSVPEGGGAGICASAAWIGKSYIFANGWYKGDNDFNDDWQPSPFDGADLGEVVGPLRFGGRCRTYGEPDGEGNPAYLHYQLFSDADGTTIDEGTQTLWWYDYSGNDNWFRSSWGNREPERPGTIDLAGVEPGTPCRLAVWFEAKGTNDTSVWDNNGGANYVATFTAGGDGEEPPAWIGGSYIYANGWYKGDGESYNDWTPAAFDGADLGRISGSIAFGGQCQTYPMSKAAGEEHPARACWNVVSDGSVVMHGSCTLSWYDWNVTGTARNNWFESRGDGGTWQTADIDASGLADGSYSLEVWFEADGADGTVYDNNGGANYVATFTVGEDPGPSGRDVTVPQFAIEDGHPVIHAKMAHGNGQRTWLYYTTDGGWPNGCAGKSPDRNVSVADGRWVGNQWERDSATGEWGITGSWWRFDLPALPRGTVLKYKIGGAAYQGDENGWDTVWPGNPGEVERKTKITGEWRVPKEGGLDLRTLSYRPHNDYGAEATGLAEGFHLFTVRCWPSRPEGSEVFNTFRQTFYMDAETPRGTVLWPAPDSRLEGTTYGVGVQTDRTVEKVYYHITDTSAANDGPGNGTNAEGRVEWAEATLVNAWTEDMATNTALPKVWKFNYNGIAPGGNAATIRVRLWEWSSAPTNRWSAADPADDDPAALHVTEIQVPVTAAGINHHLYFDWPPVEGEMVEYGWDLRLRHDWAFTDNMGSEADKAALFTVEFASPDGKGGFTTNRVDGSDASVVHDGDQLLVKVPNLFTGDERDLHLVTVTGRRNLPDEGLVELVATNAFRTRGPLQPACIIATPPERDSDGVKYVIKMEDLPASAIAANPKLRQTPVIVHTDWAVTNLDVRFTSPEGYVPDLMLTDKTTNATAIVWTYVWTVEKPGTYSISATATADLSRNTRLNVATNTATRTATVQFRQKTPATDPEDPDWDDDGLGNTNEITQIALPSRNDEQWTQDEVFAHYRTGRTDPASPDGDGDGLPDGLELGVRWPIDGTDESADTNGDGWKNFAADWDPPLYNTSDNFSTVKGVSKAGSGARRDVIVQGSVTDPNNPDSDWDGLPDGVEDANRNGWADGDGQSLPPDWLPFFDRKAPNGEIDGDETWQETSPCVADSDGDGLSDGYGEDKDFDGKTAIFLKYADGTEVPIDLASAQWAVYRAVDSPLSRAVNWKKLFEDYSVNGNYDGYVQREHEGWPHLIVKETDPLNRDTDGDGLPDGWEIRYGFDPLDNGVYNFATGLAGDPVNGADGNPDGDILYNADGSTTPNTNLLECQAGTNPTVPDSIENPGGSGTIVVGEGAEIGSVNGTSYHREFLDWRLDDLIALDDYNVGGKGRVDIYRWWDGFDSSRDIVAFYFRDGGVESEGGDGKLYFRVDFDDLIANAENGSLDLYVAINFGQPSSGERKLPDDVDALTAMGWNAVVGVFGGAEGVVYVDRDSEHNSTSLSDDLEEMGVGTGTYHGAYFNSQLDSVMWYIDRADLGTVDPGNFLFQVYTVRDGTGPGGAGNKSDGRNDFTDTIGDDWLCSDIENDKEWIAANGVYSTYFGKRNAWNDCGRHAKLAMVAHGNQAIEAASTIQAIVDNGAGAGYQRPVKIHNIYTNCPLNLHITPTLAMALEWAKAGTEKTWVSGPALNAEIRSGAAKGNFRLLASTFSDHILPYFPEAFNRANAALAEEILNTIYGGSPTNKVVSTNIFWAPERVADAAVLAEIAAMGYQATLIDQTPHMLEWFDRETALSSPGYKIQDFWIDRGGDRWVNAKAFVLSTAVDEFRYANTDGGLPVDLRRLFLRRARSGDAALSTIFYMWEELKDGKNADAYDRNLRWIANHPWTQVVALEDALGDGSLVQGGDRHRISDAASLPLEAHDWVHHACNENYDNWYFGSGRHEGLAGKRFEINQGRQMAREWGSATNGILAATWATVSGIRNADVKRLAEETLFASVFETAFHIEDNGNLSRWSYGDYVSPATGWHWDETRSEWVKMGLQSFSWRAQSRTRLANAYGEVDDWAGRTLAAVEVRKKDVDLDGDDEWILRNNKLMALFEAEGGIMTGAWFKNGTNVWQVVGNFAAIPENGYEDEESEFIRYVQWEDGSWHGYLNAQRGSALKDVEGGSRTAVYGVETNAGSITFSHGGLSKTVSLTRGGSGFAVSYAGQGALKVRNGLSPDLDAMMRTGQGNMAEPTNNASTLCVKTVRPDKGTAVTATLRVSQGAIDTGATDKPVNVPETFETVNLYNAAHVRQVDVTGNGALAFTLAFAVEEPENLPPVIAINPDKTPQVFPVGTESRFTVEATDPDSASFALSCDRLPRAGNTLASFSPATGVFSWTPSHLSQGTRREDFETNATFTATDSNGNATSRTVRISIPWDSDGDELPDDWEWLRFGTLAQSQASDWDGDEFRDGDEYRAGTSPTDKYEYLGWESLFVDSAAGTATMTFQSVPGKSYVIQATDAQGILQSGGTGWTDLSRRIAATGWHTTWSDTVPDADSRMYRIRLYDP